MIKNLQQRELYRILVVQHKTDITTFEVLLSNLS